MIDDGDLCAVRDHVEAGGAIPVVSVEDLKRAWSALPVFRAQTTGPKTDLLRGPKAGGVFARFIVLAGLIEKGVPLSAALFEKVATTPLNKDNLLEFQKTFRP